MNIEKNGDVLVAHLDPSYGALDEQHIAQAQSELYAALDRSLAPLLLLDFGSTEYFGSSFIETVVRVWTRVNRAGGRFALCRLNADCREILQTAKLDKLWTMTADSVEQGVTQLRQA